MAEVWPAFLTGLAPPTACEARFARLRSGQPYQAAIIRNVESPGIVN